MRTADFDYRLPEGAIAQEAIEPRDASRLLVARTLEDRRFSDLPELLGAGDLLVVNRTRVRAARLRGRRVDTDGTVELLVLRRLGPQRWETLLRPARRMHPGVTIDCGPILAEVLGPPMAGVAVVALTTDQGEVDDVLSACGEVPLPPYFVGSLHDPERYQTIFAKTKEAPSKGGDSAVWAGAPNRSAMRNQPKGSEVPVGVPASPAPLRSAAAPTAGLHFTPRLVDRLVERGVSVAEVELEVGLDTFRPMATENVDDHVIHRERYRVPEATAWRHSEARSAGGRIVAVGTTVARTLETVAARDGIEPGEGESSLFIVPGHRFRAIDVLITNFHAPRTTLIALVAASLGAEWRKVYAAALERGYRFLSFGDAMLIDPVGSDQAWGDGR